MSTSKNTVKSFDEYFKDRTNCRDEVGQVLLADAKKVVEALKTPEAIVNFSKNSASKRVEILSKLDKRNIGLSFYCVCLLAAEYANYAQSAQKEVSVSNEAVDETRGKGITRNLTSFAAKMKRDPHN